MTTTLECLSDIIKLVLWNVLLKFLFSFFKQKNNSVKTKPKRDNETDLINIMTCVQDQIPKWLQENGIAK